MVAIASVCQRQNRCLAINANESAVFVVPRHLRLPGFEFQGSRVPFALRPSGRSRLDQDRDHFTALPRRLLPVPASGVRGNLRSIRTKARFVQLDGPL
jgi:hypothetical protein